jgi:agmatinase
MQLQIPRATPATRAVGRPGTFADLHRARLDGRWCVFGVPVAYDCPRPEESPAAGPELIRGAVPYFALDAAQLWDFDRGRALSVPGVAPLDLGDLGGAGRPLPEVLPDVEFVPAAVAHAGGRPLVLGGEHWLSLPVVEGLARYHPDGFHVIHFDAHTDRQWPDDPSTPLYNGNVMSFVARHERVRGLVQLGVREFEAGRFRPAGPYAGDGSTVHTTRDLRTAPSPAALYDSVPPGAKVYLSVDVDVLDPSVAPEVAFPVADGLDLATLLDHVDLIGSRYDVIGVDLVELASSGSRVNLGALALGRLLMTVLATA